MTSLSALRVLNSTVKWVCTLLIDVIVESHPSRLVLQSIYGTQSTWMVGDSNRIRTREEQQEDVLSLSVEL